MVLQSNQFVRNPACCLMLSKSISNSSVLVSKNHFFRNLLNIKCYLQSNKRALEISGNRFEVPVNQRNKTIKFLKKFSNLKLNDNEFVVIEAHQGDEHLTTDYFRWAHKNLSQSVSEKKLRK